MRRRRWYFAMMGTCVVLFILAWSTVRLWSVPAAIGMCLIAAAIPPIAVIVANRRGPEERWFDEQSGDPQSDEWWAELDGKKKNGQAKNSKNGKNSKNAKNSKNSKNRHER